MNPVRSRWPNLQTLVWIGAALMVALLIIATSETTHAAGTTYYVDCSFTGTAQGTQSNPWKTLASVTDKSGGFAAGDSILLKRGTTCSGAVWPKGSGSSGSPITLGAYGTGRRPIISAGTNEYAIKLFNQEYWKIENIETTGGTKYGVYISGDGSGTLTYFRLTDLDVHDVNGASSLVGSVVFIGGSTTSRTVSDVIVDNVTAHDSTQWNGIQVGGGAKNYTDSRNTNLTVRNSTVHDVYGNGIVLYTLNNGKLENNVAYNTGESPAYETGSNTPNGIWTWHCNTCTVQYNEAYNVYAAPNSKNKEIDGGAYDIDFWSDNTTVQYNYGHDADGYCVAIFGAENQATTNSIVRYNVCANNGRNSNTADQGDFYTSTWNGGSLNGLQIYNNTSYFNPNGRAPLLKIGDPTTFSGTQPRFVKNNLFVTTHDWLVSAARADVTLNNNLYWYTGGTTPWWYYNATWHQGFSTYKSGSSQDAQGIYADPKLNEPTYHGQGISNTAFTLQSDSPAINAGTNVCSGITGCSMGTRDFFGNTIPQGTTYDIGAYEGSGRSSSVTNLLSNPGFESGSSNWSWWPTNGASVVNSNARSGSNAMKISSTNAGIYRTVTQLSANTTYTFRGYLKAGSAGNTGYLFVKNYGGSEVKSATVQTTSYTLMTVTFTTGASNTSAEVGVWRSQGPDAGSGDLYADDFELFR